MAQEQFLRQFAPSVFRFIVRMTRQEQEAEELTQDTLLRAMQQIGRFDATQSTLHTWVCHIAYRLTLNHLRNRGISFLSIEERADVLTAADEAAMSQAFAEANATRTELLQQALEHLAPDEQTLLNLFYFEDLPLQEIGYIIEAPPGTIATRLYRIRKKLYHFILKLQQQ
jgi:RNA polymerase sigma-70 factor (ECF subfamily)